MQNYLDFKTLCFTTSIIHLILCFCLFYVYKTRKTYDGFQFWVTASIIQFTSFVFMMLRNVIPDALSVVVGNTLIITGIAFIIHGLEVFTESRKRSRLLFSCTIFTAIVFTYFTYLEPNVSIRIIIISTIIALLYFYAAAILYNSAKRQAHNNSMVLILAFSIQAIWNVIRVLQTGLFENQLADFFNSSNFQAVTIAVFFCGNIIVTIGLIVLNFQRVEHDLVSASDEVNELRGILPICSHCKVIRNEKGAWIQLEEYIAAHSDAVFSHGICDSCMQQHHPDIV